MLGRTTAAQVIRDARELLAKRTLPAPEDVCPFLGQISFPNGGPGQVEPTPPWDYLAWRNGGPAPDSVEGLDWMLKSLELEEEV